MNQSRSGRLGPAGFARAPQNPRSTLSISGRGGDRTRTPLSGYGILSPVRLPVSPLGQPVEMYQEGGWLQFGLTGKKSLPSTVLARRSDRKAEVLAGRNEPQPAVRDPPPSLRTPAKPAL